MLSLEQKLSILSAPGFVIQKRQNLNFDLTLTRDTRSILNLKYALGRSRGELSKVTSRGPIPPLVLEIAGGGGGESDPPLPVSRGYGNSPGGAGLTSAYCKTTAATDICD